MPENPPPSYRRAARDADTQKGRREGGIGATGRRRRVSSHETPTMRRGRGWRKVGGANEAGWLVSHLLEARTRSCLGLEQGQVRGQGGKGARGLIRSRGQWHQQGKHAIHHPSSIHGRRRRRRRGSMLLQHPGAATSEIGNRGCWVLPPRAVNSLEGPSGGPRRPTNGRRLRKQNVTEGLHATVRLASLRLAATTRLGSR